MNTSKIAGILACGIGAVLCGTHRIEAGTDAINTATTYQTIRGYGASTAWGSSMSASDADLLWSTTTGAGLSLHRIHIDDASGSTSELSIAKLAVARGVTVWATPWTPPAADKTNNNTVMGSLSNASAFATYLKNFVATMKTNGVPIYAISAQNEPDANVTYESCVYTGATMATWVGGTMGPAFAGSGIKVMAPETQNWCDFTTWWPTLKASTSFMQYADIIATHEYGCSPSAYPDIAAAGKEFWETEIYDTDGTEDPGMGSALRVAALIHAAMTVSNMNAWHYWWVYPSGTDNGALWDKGTGQPSKRLWIMGNFSRYVRPGFVRVSATASPTSGVTVSAYYKASADSLAIVAINTNTSATSQAFTISGVTGNSVVPVITDGTRSLVAQSPITVSGNAFTYSLPSQSVTTLVVKLGTTGILSNSVEDHGSLQILRGSDGLRIELPSENPGRLELLALDGRLLDSRNVPGGAKEFKLGTPDRPGMMVVKLLQGNTSWSTDFVNP
jgi:glucuronoarabinoxylan endo-1,4-beta-xylanase